MNNVTVSTNASRRIHQELLAAVMAGKRVVELPRDYLPGESFIVVGDLAARHVFRIERSADYTLAILTTTYTQDEQATMLAATTAHSPAIASTSELYQIGTALGLRNGVTFSGILDEIQRQRDEVQRANKILAAYCPECDPSRSSLTSTVDLLVADVLSENRCPALVEVLAVVHPAACVRAAGNVHVVVGDDNVIISSGTTPNQAMADAIIRAFKRVNAERSSEPLVKVLATIDSEAQIVKVETDPAISVQYHGYVTTRSMNGSAVTVTAHAPTHAIVDADGESIGCGLSANDAIVDAIVREHERVCKAYDKLRAAVREARRTSAALDELV